MSSLDTVLLKIMIYFFIKYLPAEILSAPVPQMIEIIYLESLAFERKNSYLK